MNFNEEMMLNKKYPIGGIGASTDLDAHGERFTKEALEQMAQGMNDRAQLMYWNHETTLPPIGIITSAWVEQREDGEYQLFYEGYLFEDGDTEFLPNSEIMGLDISQDDVKRIIDSTELAGTGTGHLRITYDPRNFDPENIDPIIDKFNEVVETEQGFYGRKAEIPHAVIWVLIGFAAGNIAAGFFTRIGEIAAEQALELAKNYYKQLGNYFEDLFKQAKPEGIPPDIIFCVPIEGSATVVEGALERAETAKITIVLEKLPDLYAIAKHIIDRNQEDFFSVMRFLFNPSNETWEINYLVTRNSNRIIKGTRYYYPQHSLRERYDETLKQLADAKEEADSNDSEINMG